MLFRLLALTGAIRRALQNAGDGYQSLVESDGPVAYWKFDTTATSGDPYWNNTVLLMHMDGSNGSTTFTNVGSGANSFTRSNTITISTANSKFGGASLTIPGGTGKYVWSNSTNTAWGFGSGPLTWEAWIYQEALGGINGVQIIMSNVSSTAGHDGSFCVKNGTLGLQAKDNVFYDFQLPITLNTWTHVAMTYDGTTLSGYRDGVKGTDHTATFDFGPAARYFIVSGDAATGWYGFDGYIDEVRATKAIRYTGNFAPPTAAFPEIGVSTNTPDFYGGPALTLSNVSSLSTPLINDGTGSLLLNGTDQKALSNTADYRISDTIGSIEAWATTSQQPLSGQQTIFATSDTATNGYNIILDIFDNSGTPHFSIAQKDGVDWDRVYGHTIVQPDTTYHVVAACENSQYFLYVNGELQTLTDGSQTPPYVGAWFAGTTNRDNISVGALTRDVTSNYWEGTIDEVAIYDYPLSHDTVLEHYKTGAELQYYSDIIKADNPVDYWRLNDTNQVTANTGVAHAFLDFDNTAVGNYPITLSSSPVIQSQAGAMGGKALYFDGSTRAATIAANVADVDFGTNDFTVECWFYLNGNTSTDGNNQRNGTLVSVLTPGNSTTMWNLFVNGDATTTGTGFAFEAKNSNTHVGTGIGVSISQYEWHHVAVCQTGGFITFYLDGKNVGQSAAPAGGINSDLGSVVLGHGTGTSSQWRRQFKGYIQNVIITNGTALYTADFKPKRELVQTLAPAVGDHLLRIYGGVTLGSNSLLEKQGRTSGVFNGTDGYAFKDVSNYRSSDSQGSIEAWIQTSDTANEKCIFTSGDEQETDDGFGWYVQQTTGFLRLFIAEGGTLVVGITGNTNVADGKIHHVVLTSDGSTLRQYIDGVEDTFVATDNTNTGQWFDEVAGRDNIAVGALIRSSTSLYFNGTIDEIAVYDYALSLAQVQSHYDIGKTTAVPTYRSVLLEDSPISYWSVDSSANSDPLIYLPGTGLKFNGGNGSTSYTDDFRSKTFTRHGSASQSSTQVKFGASSHFNGSTTQGSALEVASSNADTDFQLTGDFTVEMWVYVTGIPEFNFAGLFTKMDTSHRSDTAISAFEMGLVYDATSSSFRQTINVLNLSDDNNYGLSSGTGFPINEWHHIAWCRNGGTLTAYLDGVAVVSRSDLGSLQGVLGDRRVLIGASTQNTNGERHSLAGYIDDFFFVNGYAKYTENFTAPTTELQFPTFNTTLTDLVGSVPLTMVNEPQPDTGIVATVEDGATQFDGTDQYATAATNFRGTDAQGTMEAWVKTGHSNDVRYVFSVSGDTGPDGCGISVTQRGQLGYFCYTTEGGTYLSGNAGPSLNDDLPHHIVATSDGSTIRTYVDGAEVEYVETNGTNTGQWLADTNFTITSVDIGTANRDVPTAFFDGTIDEVAYYDQPLTYEKVKDHYLKGAVISDYERMILEDEALHYWQFDEDYLLENDVLDVHFNGLNTDLATGKVPNTTTATISSTEYKFGGFSLFFDGVNDYYSYANNAAWDIADGQGRTIEMWLFPTSFPSSNWHSVITWWGSTSWRLLLGTNGFFHMSTEGTGAWSTATNVIELNEWTHIKWVIETDNTQRFFVNGVQTVHMTTPLSYTASNSTLKLGTNTAGEWLWNGYMDEVRIAYGAENTTSDSFVPPTINRRNVPDRLLKKGGTTLGTPVTNYFPLINTGKSVKYLGSDNTVLPPLTLTDDAAFAFETWINKTDTNNGTVVCLMPQGSHTNGRGLVIRVSSDGTLSFQYGSGSGSWAPTVSTASGAIENHRTYHIAGVYEGVGQNVYLYINGVEVANDTAGGITWVDNGSGNTAYWSLGADISGGGVIGNYWSGRIDEAAVYEKALTPAEVLNHYNTGKPNTYTAKVLEGEPVSYWKMDESSGTTIVDTMGRNDGTLSTGHTLQQASLLTGSANSILIDGTDDASSRIDLGFDTNYTSLTVEFWFQLQSAPAHNMMLVSKSSYFADTITDFPFYMQVNSLNQVSISASQGDDFNNDASVVSPALQTSVPYHVVGVWNNNDRLELWINSVKVDSETVSFALSTNTRNWSLGAPTFGNSGGADTAFTEDVLMSDVSIYDRDISHTEIIEKYYTAVTRPDSYYTDDANTDLLIQSNESDGATTIADASSNTRSITNTDVTHSTTHSVFGTSSLYFDGNDDLEIESFAIGTQDFTIEAWVRPTTTATYSIMSKWNNSGNLRWDLNVNSAGGRIDFVMYNAPPSQRVAYANVSIPTDQWTHVAVTRQDSDGAITFFINGKMQTTNGSVAENPYGDSGYTLFIGREKGGSKYFTGWMDEIRISNSIRWTSNFLPK